MKNFYQYLAPFAPDYSGAAAVFRDTGALTVICDPGGCSGNVCGYDEPRFYSQGGAIYSAALRDMDTILGRDKKLAEKIVSAAICGSFPFIALIGTPVSSVIATDLEALCRQVEQRAGIPCVSVDTNGMDYYHIGQKKARRVLERRFPGKYPSVPTPLDSMPGPGRLARITDAVKTAGLLDKKLLIIHQKDAALLLKQRLQSEGAADITTGSWFGGCDLSFDDEDAFIETCMVFDGVIADPLYFRALANHPGILIDFPHLAVSGDLYMENWDD